jgi:hypothetical protein
MTLDSRSSVRNETTKPPLWTANAKNAAAADGKPTGTAMVEGKPAIRVTTRRTIVQSAKEPERSFAAAATGDKLCGADNPFGEL